MTPTTPSAAVNGLRRAITDAAQSVYDAWEQDEDGIDEVYGAGGICDDVASGIASVLSERLGVDAYVQHVEMDCHTLVIAAFADGVFTIDIPPSVYERGTGYVWRKVPGVVLGPDDVAVSSLSDDPSRIVEYVDHLDEEPPCAAPTAF